MAHLKITSLIASLIVTLVAFGIYMSDWNLANQDAILWFYGFMALVIILLVWTLPKKKWQKISLIVGLSALTGFVGFYLIFISFLKCEEKIIAIWNIEEYKISYGYSECIAWPAEESKYKLEKTALGGILIKRLDIVWKSKTENLVTNKTFVVDKNCILEFMDGKYQFDLCAEKNIGKNVP